MQDPGTHMKMRYDYVHAGFCRVGSSSVVQDNTMMHPIFCTMILVFSCVILELQRIYIQLDR